jgi:transcriptional regulator with XRE-family HTH domain
MSELYLKVKAIRIEKKLTQKDVAKEIGMNQSNYTRIESGLTALTIERIEELAKVFEMTVSEMINYEGGEIGKSEVSEYLMYIKQLEKERDNLQEQIDEKLQNEDNDYIEHKKDLEKLQTEIKNLKSIIKEKDERLKDKDMIIDALKMVINSRGENSK